jgi:hypothetical protein
MMNKRTVAQGRQPAHRRRIVRYPLVRAGLASAKSEGKRLGRPPLPEKTQGAIREALKERTEGVRKIAARFGVDPSTVQRISVAMRPFGVSEGG